MVANAGTAAEFTLSAFCSLSFTYAVLSPTLYMDPTRVGVHMLSILYFTYHISVINIMLVVNIY